MILLVQGRPLGSESVKKLSPLMKKDANFATFRDNDAITTPTERLTT